MAVTNCKNDMPYCTVKGCAWYGSQALCCNPDCKSKNHYRSAKLAMKRSMQKFRNAYRELAK